MSYDDMSVDGNPDDNMSVEGDSVEGESGDSRYDEGMPGETSENGEEGPNLPYYKMDQDVSAGLKIIGDYNATVEFKKAIQPTTSQLATKILKEWDDDIELVKLIFKTIIGESCSEGKVLRKDDECFKKMTNVSKYKLLGNFFDTCKIKGDSIKNPLFIGKEYEEEYDWIETWKKDATSGGKGLLVNGKLFDGTRGIELYREKIAESIKTNKNANLITSQIGEITADEVLPTTGDQVRQLFNSYSEIVLEDQVFKAVGQIVIRPSAVERDEVSSMLNKIKEKTDYTVDDLLDDFQNKMKMVMTNDEQKKFRKNVNDIGKETVFVKDLFDHEFINKRKDTSLNNPYEIENISVIMGNLSMRKRKNYGDVNPYSDGKVIKDSVVYNKYPKEIEFIKPYKDPHFLFLNGVVETWVPQVHFLTGLPVFHVQEEVKSYKNLGRIVYIKLQETTIKRDNAKDLKVVYFRKFIDFDDYLKSWQEKYVKDFILLGEEIKEFLKTEKETEKENKEVNKVITEYKNISLFMEKRRIYSKRIGDIKRYFKKKINDNGNNGNNEKLVLFISDAMVETQSSFNELDKKLLEFVQSIQNDIESKYNKCTDVIKSFEDMNNINIFRAMAKNFLRYFPSAPLKNIIKVSKKEKEFINLKMTALKNLKTEYTKIKIEIKSNDLSNLFEIETIDKGCKTIKVIQPKFKKFIENSLKSVEESRKCKKRITELHNSLNRYANKKYNSELSRRDGLQEIFKNDCEQLLSESLSGILKTLINAFGENANKGIGVKCQRHQLGIVKEIKEIIEVIVKEHGFSDSIYCKLKILYEFSNELNLYKTEIDEIKNTTECEIKDKLLTQIFETYKSIVDLVLVSYNTVLEENNELLRQEIENDRIIENVLSIVALLETRSKVKEFAKKIYDDYTSFTKQVHDTEPDYSEQDRINNLIRMKRDENKMSVDAIKQEVNKLKSQIKDEKKFKACHIKIDNFNTKLFASNQINSLDTYVNACTKVEKDLYDKLMELQTNFKRKSIREYDLQLESFQNTKPYNKPINQEPGYLYDKMLKYLEKCYTKIPKK